MLAPRSAKALHVLMPENSHGIRNLPGSPSFFAFSLRLSSFLLDGNGIDDLGIGVTTGETLGSGITGGWTSSVLPLLAGGIVSFVTSVSWLTAFGPWMVTPLRVVDVQF
ncbi:hypothetical protein Tco_1047088 [Tanacetum coccineum]